VTYLIDVLGLFAGHAARQLAGAHVRGGLDRRHGDCGLVSKAWCANNNRYNRWWASGAMAARGVGRLGRREHEKDSRGEQWGAFSRQLYHYRGGGVVRQSLW
jgi:hypothetical protein